MIRPMLRPLTRDGCWRFWLKLARFSWFRVHAYLLITCSVTLQSKRMKIKRSKKWANSMVSLFWHYLKLLCLYVDWAGVWAQTVWRLHHLLSVCFIHLLHKANNLYTAWFIYSRCLWSPQSRRWHLLILFHGLEILASNWITVELVNFFVALWYLMLCWRSMGNWPWIRNILCI